MEGGGDLKLALETRDGGLDVTLRAAAGTQARGPRVCAQLRRRTHHHWVRHVPFVAARQCSTLYQARQPVPGSPQKGITQPSATLLEVLYR